MLFVVVSCAAAAIGTRPVTFDLSLDQRNTLGTSLWISDPLHPLKNVARPSFAFRQIQLLLGDHLATIERDHFRSIGSVGGSPGGLIGSMSQHPGINSTATSFHAVSTSSGQGVYGNDRALDGGSPVASVVVDVGASGTSPTLGVWQSFNKQPFANRFNQSQQPAPVSITVSSIGSVGTDGGASASASASGGSGNMSYPNASTGFNLRQTHSQQQLQHQQYNQQQNYRKPRPSYRESGSPYTPGSYNDNAKPIVHEDVDLLRSLMRY